VKAQLSDRYTAPAESNLLLELAEKLQILGIDDPIVLNKLKLDFCKQHNLDRMPRNSDILSVLPIADKKRLTTTLQLKKVRSVSGVNVIGVMSLPRGCPHGRCVFCPMENGIPMSYVSGEPSVMRGFQSGYDPFVQITSRLNQLKAIGHTPSKVELVIQGGTFLAAPSDYQEHFVKRSLDALNGTDSRTLDEAKSMAEAATIRNVGLTIETKPDWCKKPHVDQLLRFGATRVEIGVQVLDDHIYKLTNRGHSLQDVVESFEIAKDAGLKIVAHMMPGLPGSNPEKDLQSFQRLFEDERFRPDMIKIYPCLVVEGTTLYEWWKAGKYKPYETDEAVRLIAKIKTIVPPWVRIMRVQREFPVQRIAGGPKSGNLRELAINKLKLEGKKCRCIRCREIGHRMLKEKTAVDIARFRIMKRTYRASNGTESFVSIEDPESDTLVGYLRLRFPSTTAHRPEIGNESALVRELHIYGPEVPVGQRSNRAWQHRGFGRRLLSEAETYAKTEGAKKLVIISALGTKAYYKRLGYGHNGPYMSKILS
jgi:elongator complex protein 3